MKTTNEEEPPFEIVVDEAAGVVRMVLRGFWSMADLMAYAGGMSDAIGRVARRHAVFALISDSSAFKIQSSEVAETLARMVEMGNRTHIGPTAIIVGSTLNKLQAERMFPDPRVRVFTDSGEAQRWVETELAATRGKGATRA